MGAPPSVLVVDDDLLVGEMMQRALSEAGVDVHVTKDGREALDFLRRATTLPALIVLDWAMPVMGGDEVLRHLRRDPRLASIPVVVFSATERHGTLAPPVAAVLTKPVRLRTVIDVVTRLAGVAQPASTRSRRETLGRRTPDS
jgi:two-component system, chemotaxis family, chemotaxis protein CheY